MIWIMIILFLLMMVIGIPIAYSMGLSSLVYMIANNIPISMATQRFFSNSQSFAFLAVPFFILAGNIMVEAGIAKRLIGFADVLVRHLPGGLACVSVITSMLMAGVSGSSVADASSVGAILIPEMERKGYDNPFSAAINATSSVVGIIIPPSSTMIIIAWISGLSVARMFMAGAIPGIMISMMYLGITIFISKKRNYPREKRATLKEIYRAFLDSFWTLILPIFIIGSILTGIATPTESAAISAVYALFIGVFIYKTLNFKNILRSLIDSAKGTSIVMLVVCSASIFTWILIREGVPTLISNAVLGLGIPNFLMMGVLILILLLAGMFMDLVPNLFIFIPIFFPIVESMGGDLIHFSIVMLCSLAMGLFTPPVGTTLFISCHIAGITIEETIKDVVPFLIGGAIVILIVAYNPMLALWLPNLLFK